MSESTPLQVEAAGRPDGLFALVGGLYVAAILGPIAVALARRVVRDVGSLYVVLLVASTGSVVVGALAVRRREGAAERLGNTHVAWLLVATPLAAMAAVLVVDTLLGGVVTGASVLLVLLGGFGAASLGFVLVSMAKTRYAVWYLDRARTETSWSAPWPKRIRRRVWYAAGAALALGTVAFVGGALFEQEVLRIVGQLLVPIGAVLATVGRPVTYRATSRGLEIRYPVARRVRPWSAFEGYRLSGDALVLVRSGPLEQSIHCDAAAIDEPRAVSQALDAHLERLS